MDLMVVRYSLDYSVSLASCGSFPRLFGSVIIRIGSIHFRWLFLVKEGPWSRHNVILFALNATAFIFGVAVLVLGLYSTIFDLVSWRFAGFIRTLKLAGISFFTISVHTEHTPVSIMVL